MNDPKLTPRRPLCSGRTGIPHVAVQDAQAMGAPLLRLGKRFPVSRREEKPGRHQEDEGGVTARYGTQHQ